MRARLTWDNATERVTIQAIDEVGNLSGPVTVSASGREASPSGDGDDRSPPGDSGGPPAGDGGGDPDAVDPGASGSVEAGGDLPFTGFSLLLVLLAGLLLAVCGRLLRRRSG